MTERILAALGRLEEIPSETAVPEPFRDYFTGTARFLLTVKRGADVRELYSGILPENYASSYANPDYAVRMLGDGYGQLLSAVYAELLGIIPAVFEGDDENTAILLELFLELYFEFENEVPPEPRTVKKIFGGYIRDYLPFYIEKQMRERYCPENSFAAGIIMRADSADPSCLSLYGEYFTDDTVRTAEFLASLPEETIGLLAETFTGGFLEGYRRAGKDLSGKRTVQVLYELGFERVVRRAAEKFREMGLEPTYARTPVNLLLRSAGRGSGYGGVSPNPQFDRDHREDICLVLDENFASSYRQTSRLLFEKMREDVARHAGPALLETFGREPSAPLPCGHALRMNGEESERWTGLRNSLMLIRQRFLPETERSYTIMALPVPAVGREFEDIFFDTVRVNTLDSGRCLEIQQKLIDALDRASRVEIRGADGNLTDLTVALHPMTDPKTQTLFENCVADVNIPAGEVFTSPRLTGTNGTLHVKRVFLRGNEFLDLRIAFKDGMISSISCGNFEDPAENRRYVEDNILFRHPTLPLGEFAIGTNTAAYVMARKYGIGAKLPILIAEKTGPHFAVGDTCYGGEEDSPVYNPDGKEIIARDNEHTLIRKTDPSKAYYGCHTDITVPFEELRSVRAVAADGTEIPLIEGGRFVLPGTEELNIPLDAESFEYES